MTPAAPAIRLPAVADADDPSVPDYVQALEQAAAYLPEEQRPLLRRAWAVGAAAHAGQNRRSGEPYIDAVDKAERERKEREALEWAAAEVVADDDLSKGDD